MDSFVLVIFGITSNLAKIKLIPALYDLFESDQLGDTISIIGIARSPMEREAFHEYIDEVLALENRHHQHPINQEVAHRMKQKMHYLDGNVDDPSTYKKMIHQFDALETAGTKCKNRIYYLATYPDLYHRIFEQLKAHELTQQHHGWARVMIEKPIGTDKESAKALNNVLAEYYEEDQIFRLDHYLGKETLQNIITFRFANGIFEHLMNDTYVDHVQITAAEDFGIGDRGAYYDSIGALKDVGQNHLLQMLALALMSEPKGFSNESITQERVALLNKLTPDPNYLVYGQYEGYHRELNVKSGSSTDTYFACKLNLTNERFTNLPIYLRGGKMLKQTVTEISIVFKNSPLRQVSHLPHGTDPNVLIYRIQPNEGIVLKLLTKKPGHEIALEETYMQFCYKFYQSMLPDPYQRLILDAFRGDQTFFVDAEEVEAQWKITDVLSDEAKQSISYGIGSWGPKEADELISRDGRSWLEPSLAFCAL